MENENTNNSPKPVTAPMLEPGTMLQGGKYRIEKVLGQGGFGITYLATMMMLNQKVAIKEFFFKEFCERNSSDSTVLVTTHAKKDLVERFQQKFLKEANIIFGLRHENIIKLLDVFQENDTSYYAMEYVEGKSLSEEVKAHGPMSTEKAMEVMKSMCGALGCIHSRKINHLDIKPQNIMLDEKEHRVVLIDFGVSKQYDPTTGDCNTTTPVGVSEGYSPLEQYNQGGVSSFSPQSDIYSLGATLYKLVTGKTPPSAIDISQNGLPELPATVAPAIAEAIKKAMQPARNQRPQSVEEFWNLLNVKPQPVEMPDDDEDEETCFIDPSAPPVAPAPKTQPAAQQKAPAQQPKPAARPTAQQVAQPAATVKPKGKKMNVFVKIIIGIGIAIALFFASLFVYGMFLGVEEAGSAVESEYMDPSELNSAIEELVAEENSNCPQDMGDGCLLNEVSYTDGVLEYVIQVDEDMYSIDKFNEGLDQVKQSVIETLTSNIEADPFYQAIVDADITIRYVYVGSDSGESVYFDIHSGDLR